MSGRVVVSAVNISVQSLALPPDFDPVFRVITEIEGDVNERLATYCDAFVEQPAVSASAGITVPCVETYSETDVLHAANAATPSDIFDLMM
jgi:hypothetical protein